MPNPYAKSQRLAALFFLLSAVAFLVVAYLTTRWLAVISGLMSVNAVLYFIRVLRRGDPGL